jgi:hypothetical protein
VTVVDNVELAFSEGVPELDRSVSRGGDDLSVVGREGDGEDVAGVANELSGGQTCVEVPKTEGLVPRRGKGELSVGRDGDVGDKVVVAVQDLLGESERVVVSRELPDDDGLVCELSVLHPVQRLGRVWYAPREAVKIISGFSDEVAMAVTQPEWPARVPLNARGSAIFAFGY